MIYAESSSVWPGEKLRVMSAWVYIVQCAGGDNYKIGKCYGFNGTDQNKAAEEREVSL